MIPTQYGYTGVVLNIGATLEGVQHASCDFSPSEETKRRISTLGLDALLMNSADLSKSKTLLGDALLKFASKVKTKRFGYNNKDLINALNFLELFALYSAQANFTSGCNPKVFEDRMDKPVIKAIHIIEQINNRLENDTKEGKAVLKLQVERLDALISKILTQDLTQIEQNALVKFVEKAKKILKTIH